MTNRFVAGASYLTSYILLTIHTTNAAKKKGGGAADSKPPAAPPVQQGVLYEGGGEEEEEFDEEDEEMLVDAEVLEFEVGGIYGWMIGWSGWKNLGGCLSGLMCKGFSGP